MGEPEKTTEMEKGVVDLTSRIARELIRTPMIRSMLDIAINYMDPKSASQLIKTLIWEDLDFTATAIGAVPLCINATASALEEFGQALQTFTPKTVDGLISGVVKDIDGKEMGEAVNTYARLINTVHQDYPTFIQPHASKLISDVISAIDFGILREAVEGSSDDMVATVESINDAVWSNLAIVANIAAALPSLINVAVRSSEVTISRFNTLPPEVLASALFSIMEETDTKEVGGLINSTAHVMNLLHEGNIVLGDAAPRFQGVLSEFLSETLSAIDHEALGKAVVALSDDSEAIINSVNDAAWRNPAFIMSAISIAPPIINSAVRGMEATTSKFAELPPEIRDAISDAAGGIDTGEVGKLINSLVQFTNRLHEKDPEILSKLLSDTISAVDVKELNKAADSFSGQVVKALEGNPEFAEFTVKLSMPFVSWFMDSMSEMSKNEQSKVDSLVNSFSEKIQIVLRQHPDFTANLVLPMVSGFIDSVVKISKEK